MSSPYSSVRRSRTNFPNPFRTYSNFVYPRTMKDVFIWASYLWERNPQYRTSIQKVVSYFVSDVTVTQDADQNEVDPDAVNQFKDLLVETYDILPFILDFGVELAAAGNVFLSAERIFKRELLCPTEGCGWSQRLKALRKGRDYDWDGRHFVGECPQCHKQVKWKIKDVPAEDDGKLVRFVFRAAEDMRLQFNRLTNTYKYYYKLPSDIADGIRRGDVVYLEDTPQVFMEAAIKGDQLIEFPEDSFLSLRTKTLTCLDKLYKGWGLPLFMVAFDNIVRRQHLDKFNEAVVFDYLVPTRFLSPAPQNLKAGIDDPNRMPISGAQWTNYMSQAIRGRISNPTQWVFSPVPMQEIQVGGNKDMIPTELLEYETTQLLADMGIPQEFRQTNFQVVAPTMGLRMFERQWIHFAKGLGKMVKWMADVISRTHHIEDMKCSLDMTSFVEDDMNKQVLLNLMQSEMIAKTPVLKRYGVDYEDDLKQRIQEQKMQEDALAEQQKAMEGQEMVSSVLPPPGSVGVGQAQANIDMMQQAQGGMPPAQPGAPMALGAPMQPGMPQMPFNQGNSESASLEQLYQQAQELAQQLYSAPSNIRRSQLVQLKSTNPQLHAMVKQMMSDMAQQTASEAVAQSRQPQG